MERPLHGSGYRLWKGVLRPPRCVAPCENFLRIVQ
nr:MAG TPA: hypothetical protein [Caudoviricetes sp.]